MHRQVVRKAAEARAITLDPVVRLHYVEVQRARHARPVRRPAAAARGARREWQLDRPRAATCACCRACSRRCARASGRSRSPCTRAARSSPSGRASASASTASRSTSARRRSPRTCATSRPARSSPPAGSMNPQIRFGEDLMSRVSYSMMNPGGAQQMTEAVRGALNALAAEVAREAGVARQRHPRADPGRQPDHASPAARHRSGGTRRRAVRARDRRGADALRRPRSGSRCTRTRASTCCRASPGTSAPMPPA